MTIRRLRLVAFLGSLLLVAASVAVTFAALSEQRHDAEVINLAGRQRMLSQQMALQALGVQIGANPAYREALHTTSHDYFEKTLEALIAGGEAPYTDGATVTLPPAPNPEILAQLETVRATWREMHPAVMAVLEEDPQSAAFAEAAAAVERLSPVMLAQTDEAVRLYEVEAERKVARVQAIQIGFLGMAAALLAAAFFLSERWVLNPIARLGTAARRIGEGDLDTPVQVTGPGEINRLARSFDDMRRNLAAADLSAHLLDSMLDAVAVANPDGTIRMMNRAALELLGYTAAEVAGQPVGRFFAEEEEEEEEEVFFHGTGLARLMREGAVREVETTLITRAGERVPVIFNGSLVRDAGGGLVAVVGVARDMRPTRRLIQQAEARAAESTVLKTIAEELNRRTEIKPLMDEVLPLLSQTIGASAAWVTLLDERGNFALAGAHNLPPALEADDLAEMRWAGCTCQRKLLAGELTAAVNIIECTRLQRANGGDTRGLRYHASVPLRIGGRALGNLNLTTPQDRVFTDDELRLLTAVGDQIGVAVERARLFEAEHRRTAELTRSNALIAALGRVAALVESTPDPDRIMETLGAELKGLDVNCAVMTVDPDDGALVMRYLAVDSLALKLAEQLSGLTARGFRMRREQWPTYADLVEQRRAVFVKDSMSLMPGLLPSLARPMVSRILQLAGVTAQMRALHLPLTVEERMIGILAIWGEGLREDDLPTYSIFASQVAAALEVARLHEQVKAHHLEEQAALLRLSQALLGETEAQAVMDVAVRAAAESLKVEFAAIELIDEGGQSYSLRSGMGWPLEVSQQAQHIPLSADTAVAYAIRTRAPAVIPDHAQETRFGTPPTLTHLGITSSLFVPMLVAGEPIGGLGVNSHPPRDWSDDEVRLLSLVASDTAQALERARQYAHARERLERISALHEIDVAITSRLDLQERLDILLQKVAERLRVDAAAVAFVNHATQELVYAARHGLDGEFFRDGRLKVKEGIAGQVAHSGELAVIPDVTLEPRFVRRAIAERLGIASYLAVPLQVHGEVIGILELATRERHTFPPEEIDFFVTLAGQAAIAIENARLFVEANRRAARQRALAQTAGDILATLDESALWQAVAGAVGQTLAADRAAVYLYDAAADRLSCPYASGLSAEYVTELNRRFRDVPGTRLLADPRPIVIADAQTDPATALFRDLMSREGFHSYAVFPLAAPGVPFGALVAYRDAVAPFTPDDVATGQTLAHIVAVALQNARLFKTEREQRELAEALREVGNALTASLDFDTVLDRLLELIARVVPYDSANVMLVDDGRVHVARMCCYEQFGERVARDMAALSFEVAGTDNLRWMAETRQPLVIPDTAADPGWVKVEASAHVRSWAGAPLVVRDQVVAFFSLDKVEPNFYQTWHGQRLAAFAAQAALALHNARLFEGLAAEKRRLELLYNLSENLTAILDPRDVAARALDLTTSALGAFKGEVLVCEPDSDRLRLVAVSGYETESIEALDLGLNLRIGQGLAGYAALTRAPVIAPDVARDEHWISMPGVDDGVRSAVAIPLIAGDQLAGVLNLLSDREDFFRARDLLLLNAVAASIALALQNARLFEAERAQLLLARTLQEVGASLTSQLRLDEVLEKVLDLLGRVVQYDSISIQLIDEDGYIYLAAGRGFPDLEQARRVTRDLTDHSLSRKWAAERKAIVIPDTHADDHWIVAPGVEYIHSWIGAPLLVKNHLIGTLNVDSRTVNAFDAAMGQTVLVFANQAAIAIENARLFEAERDQARRLAAVGEVVRQAASLNLDELLHRMVDLVQQAFDYYYVNVLLVDPSSGEIELRASTDAAGRRLYEGYRLKIGKQGITGWVAANGQPLLIDDVEREPRYHFAQELAEARSELAVPILSAGQVVGVLDVQSDRRAAFAAADGDMLQTLAAHLAVAIANAQSFEEATLRFNDMRVLREVGVIISASLDLRATLTAILDQAVIRLATDATDILLLQADDRTLEYSAGRGFRTEALYHTRLQLGEGYAGRAAKEQRILNIADLRSSAGDLRRAPLLTEEAFVAYYGVPIIAKGELTGVLELFHRSPLVLGPDRLEFLQALGTQAAIAIENATLFDNLQRSHQALRDAQTRLVSAARLTAVGELAAGVAHQINNPLTTVIADAQLLLKSVGPDHPGHASAAAIFQAGWRAQRVVQRLLSFARPDEGKYVPTDVNETLVEALDLVGAHIGRGGADVKIQLATDLPLIPANGHQLEEVWINLLMNARDALVEGRSGVITLSSRLAAEGAAVEVEVADNGRGLGEADRLHLFTPFYTTKGDARGNGLGLSVCQSIVQDHGGQIRFESQPGEGTAFFIRLPLKRETA